MRWQDKLTKKERTHCKEWTGHTLVAIQRTADYQATYESKNPGYHCCFECKGIFSKLDIRGVPRNE